MPTEIKNKTHFTELINSGKTVIIDFWAPWCGPCNMISPKFEQYAGQHAEKDSVIFAKVNIDDASDVAELLGISSIPTFMAFKDGDKLPNGQVVGARISDLERLITTHAV
ncbi:thioredoxin [Coniophora puteana RWD-64-598 SS2]|uniref:Thioredoxin n=1 Tax=Coniophora puteana (strain RWD-64-598) TaxID=741705 RepID=A0A5M3N3C4_CONPW|nr:thioredoxin [Coniophora puteana RWD-64-598 SS2]EIW85826.1 thioredoxin [Coniophora puteana RWD-64-598 SS2]